jgi:hypothetical protein
VTAFEPPPFGHHTTATMALFRHDDRVELCGRTVESSR